jgi:peptidoglycan hydrolase-like protein with peptidoglycan-binding domain
MQRGDRGPTVAKLQGLLAAVGFDPVPADGAGRGVFGPRTDAQVRAFQASRKLTVNGVVGMQTWTALLTGQPAVKASQSPLPPTTAPPEADTAIEILPGMTGVAVEQLQELLIQLGRVKGAPPGIKDTPANRDGRYLAKTQERIKEFQKANGLTPDAKVGTLTWAALRLAARS